MVPFHWSWAATIRSRLEPARWLPRTLPMTDESIGVIWVDAHTDMNTPETTPSGNVHGMVLAVLTGQGGPDELQRIAGFTPAVHPDNVCVLGAREVDDEEKEIVQGVVDTRIRDVRDRRAGTRRSPK